MISEQDLTRAAEEYEAEGYRVTVRPTGDQLPEFVNGYKALYKTKANFFAGIEEVDAGGVAIFGPGRAAARQRYWRPDMARRAADLVKLLGPSRLLYGVAVLTVLAFLALLASRVPAVRARLASGRSATIA